MINKEEEEEKQKQKKITKKWIKIKFDWIKLNKESNSNEKPNAIKLG